MKQISIITATLALAVSAFGQGQMQFNNRVPNPTAGLPPLVFAPIYGVNPAAPGVQLRGNATTNGGSVNYAGVPLLTGTGFTAGLYYGAQGNVDATTFAELATANFQTATTIPGIIKNPVTPPTVPGITVNNTPGNFQVRAWDNLNGTVLTWAAALAIQTLARGQSDVLIGVPITVAPTTPVASLTGLTSFNLAVVPEPSVIALGALGLGALLLRRRKA